MKVFIPLIWVSLCLAPPVQSNDGVERLKAKMLEKLEEKAQAIQVQKSCISGATTTEGLRECQTKMREHRREHRGRFKEKHEKDVTELLNSTRRR